MTHKLLHGILGAASRGAATKLMGGNSSEVKDAALGGAIGGMVAEIVGEGLRDRSRLTLAERFISESEGKTNFEKVQLWNVLKEQELIRIRAYGELASTITAKAFGADDEAARVAARNAVDNNWARLLANPAMWRFAASVGEAGITLIKRAAGILSAAGAALLASNTVDKLKEEEKAEVSSATSSCSGGSVEPPSPQDEDPKDEKDSKNYSEKTQELLGQTDKYKKELFERAGKGKYDTTLNAARRELKGEQIDLAKQRGVEYDHISKVESAQKGLLFTIQRISKRLEYPSLPAAERQALTEELSKASKLLDYTKIFVPRN